MEGITLELTFRGTELVQARMRPHLILGKAQPNFMDPAGDGKVVMDQVWRASRACWPGSGRSGVRPALPRRCVRPHGRTVVQVAAGAVTLPARRPARPCAGTHRTGVRRYAGPGARAAVGLSPSRRPGRVSAREQVRLASGAGTRDSRRTNASRDQNSAQASRPKRTNGFSAEIWVTCARDRRPALVEDATTRRPRP